MGGRSWAVLQQRRYRTAVLPAMRGLMPKKGAKTRFMLTCSLETKTSTISILRDSPLPFGTGDAIRYHFVIHLRSSCHSALASACEHYTHLSLCACLTLLDSGAMNPTHYGKGPPKSKRREIAQGDLAGAVSVESEF